MGALVAVSFAYSLYLTATNPAAAYFVTPTRAWEFGAGGLLALFAPAAAGSARARAVVSWAGLAAIAIAAGDSTAPTTPFPGAAALLPVLGALAVIWAGAPALRWARRRSWSGAGAVPRRHLLLGLPLALAAADPGAVRDSTATCPAG